MKPTPEEAAEIRTIVRDRRRNGWIGHVHVTWDDDGQPFAVRMPAALHRRNEAVRATCKDCGERLLASDVDQEFTTCADCAAIRRSLQ